MTSPIRPQPTPEPVPAEPDDTPRLIARIRAGEVAAFEELYQRYWARLYHYSFRYLQSAEEAEDVVQEVFFRIWRGRDNWHVTGRLDHYLYVASRNGAFDRLERAAVAQQWRRSVRLNPEAMAAHACASAEEALHAGDLGAAVERALAELPEKRRAICTLRWVNGLSYAEIAGRLGIAEKTVETQIARGLSFLRVRVAELGG